MAACVLSIRRHAVRLVRMEIRPESFRTWRIRSAGRLSDVCGFFLSSRDTIYHFGPEKPRPGDRQKGRGGVGGRGAAAHAPACPEMRSFVNVFPRSAAAIYSRTELPSCHWLWAKKIVSIFQLFFYCYETFGVKFCCKFIEKFNLNGLVMNGVVWDFILFEFFGDFLWRI